MDWIFVKLLEKCFISPSLIYSACIYEAPTLRKARPRSMSLSQENRPGKGRVASLWEESKGRFYGTGEYEVIHSSPFQWMSTCSRPRSVPRRVRTPLHVQGCHLHNSFNPSPVVGHLGVSSSGPLWITLIGTFTYKLLSEPKFLWDECPTVRLLGRLVVACPVLWETT